MRLSPATRRPGMSLLEVLGATAIFLISIVAIGELMSLSTDQSRDVQFRSRATRLCQSKMNEFASGVEQLNGATSGEFEEEPGWSWSAEVTSESSALNLYRVKITVTREGDGEPVEVSMTQFVFDPLQRGRLPSTPTTTEPATGSTTTSSTTTGSTSTGASSTGTTGGATTGGTTGGGNTGGGITGGGNTGGGKGGTGGGKR